MVFRGDYMNKTYFDPFELFNEIFKDVDFAELSKGVGSIDLEELFKTAQAQFPTPAFPPVKIAIDTETKALVFRFAVAGYKKENVDIRFAGDYMLLKMKAEVKEDPNLRIIKNTLKNCDVDFKYPVPSDKYSHENVSAKMVDGILVVVVSALTDAEAKKVNIE